MAHLFIGMLMRSGFSIVVIVADFGFLCGTIVYPITLALRLVTPGIEGEGYLARNGMPGLATAVHVLLYTIGCAVGIHLGRIGSFISPLAIVRFSRIVAP